jgi:hypothetical protein
MDLKLPWKIIFYAPPPPTPSSRSAGPGCKPGSQTPHRLYICIYWKSQIKLKSR